MYSGLDELRAAYRRGVRLKYIFFWGHRRADGRGIGHEVFSQWWPSPFTVDGVRYATAEHWMMAEKARLFGDEEVLGRIIEASSPALAKKLGRQVQGFDGERWDRSCLEIVTRGSYYKFGQDSELKEYLLGTGERILVEASPLDRIWGIGMARDHRHIENPLEWKGQNLLGFALMEARRRLRES